MAIPAEYRPLYRAFIDQGLDTWLARLPEQLARGLDRKRYGDFCQLMLARGVRLIERGLWYVSTAHTEEDVRLCLTAAESALKELHS